MKTATEIRKISVFEELSVGKGIFQIGVQNQLILHNTLNIYSMKKSGIEKNPPL